MLQDGSVFLFQNIFTNPNEVIWSNSQYKTIVSCMMQFTERYSVINCQLTVWQVIRNDMGGIKQFTVLQVAKCAL